MANCRCEDIRKMKKDINTFWEINGRIDILAQSDSVAVQDLSDAGDYCTASFISKPGFEKEFKNLHGNSTDDIVILREKVNQFIETLEGSLDRAKKEDNEYHWEQVKQFFENLLPW